MNIDKYAGDYRLENIEENNKLKTVAVYRGKYYIYDNPEAAATAKPKIAVSAALLLLFTIASLFIKPNSVRAMYSLLPFYATCLPLFFLCDAVIRAVKSKTRLTRENHDKTYKRIASASFSGLFFSLFSLVGCICALISAKVLFWGDAVFVLSSILNCSLYLYVFSIKDSIKTKEESENNH